MSVREGDQKSEEGRLRVCQRGDCEATGPAHAAMDTVARGRTAFIWSQRLQRQRHVATAAAKHRRMHAQHHSMNAQNCDLDRGGGAQCSAQWLCG
eukprot:910358-Pleurochrysis_carterae.AAC.4